ncbi:MAG: GrpE protein [Dehalococcoidia bacterium]|nr:GrpE protein [Dehalococcoidia bacterium]
MGEPESSGHVADNLMDSSTIREDREAQQSLGDPETLNRLLIEARSLADSYLANWQRSQADFINYRRRSEQEKAEANQFANAMLILSVLPIVDDLERALTSVSKELAGFTWVEGVNLIYRKLQAILETHGLSEIQALGKPFDPNLHEAVMYGEGEEGVVIAELQKGYRLHDRVIRPTLVKVGGLGVGETASPTTAENSQDRREGES